MSNCSTSVIVDVILTKGGSFTNLRLTAGRSLKGDWKLLTIQQHFTGNLASILHKEINIEVLVYRAEAQ